MKSLVYKGIIQVRDYGDATDILFLDTIDDPLTEALQEHIDKKKVTVRYFIADKHETRAQLIEGLIQNLYGDATADYHSHYSEYTGYLYTDEDLIIGGHDILSEIKHSKGRFLYLEIDIHE